MEEDFFGETGETMVYQQPGTEQRQSEENLGEQFLDDNKQKDNFQLTNQQKIPSDSYGFVQEENQQITLLRQQQQAINEKLRLKSEQEYKNKEERKAQGRKQLQEFNEKKQAEIEERKEKNRANQQEKIEKLSSCNKVEGWQKVIENIELKQSVYTGKKDITRMRQSIIHKKQDELKRQK